MSQLNELNEAVRAILRKELEIENLRSVGGGSINRAYALKTSAGDFFLKANNEPMANAMFEAEIDGLASLREASSFVIPEVYGALEHKNTAYLLMDLIDSAAMQPGYWQELGNNLADLHRVVNDEFGYHRANFIGSLPQTNHAALNWGEFFIHQRMMPMIRRARDRGLVDLSFVSKFEKAMPAVVSEMPVEPASLVHGDLWSGNLIVDANGQPTIIDPAVYFGHREMDLAFSQMFGGFSQEFYDSYNEAYPLESGFSRRVDLYNLYPYLVHLNLFGRSYFGHIEQTIKKFT